MDVIRPLLGIEEGKDWGMLVYKQNLHFSSKALFIPVVLLIRPSNPHHMQIWRF